MMQAQMPAGIRPTMDVKAFAQNTQTVAHVRNLMSIVIGSAAGILGLTGFQGFILYFVLFVVTSVGIAAKMSFKVDLYFPNQTLTNFLTSGIGGQVLPFVLYWTLLYALVHLY